MVKTITTKIDVKYFVFLYKHKHLAPRTISKSIYSIYTNIDSNDLYLKFLFYVFFNDVCVMIPCPDVFENIKSNIKLLDHIRNRLFEDDYYPKNDINSVIGALKMHKSTYNSKLSTSNALFIAKLLLILEKNIPDLFFCVIDYFVFINKMLDHSDKIHLLNNTDVHTPFSVNLLLSLRSTDVPTKFTEIYHFINSIDRNPIESMKILDTKSINHIKLESDLLYSENLYIQTLYSNYLMLYPEVKFTFTKHPRRIEFFNHPLNIDMDVRTLKTYIPAVIEVLKNNLPHPRNSLVDVLLRVIYIERILKNKPSKKDYRLIHCFILDSSQVVVVLLGRRFDDSLIYNMVRYVPSMFIAFDIALKMFMKSNFPFYLKVLTALLKKYPTRNNIKKIIDHMTYLPPSFIMEFNRKINAYNRQD